VIDTGCGLLMHAEGISILNENTEVTMSSVRSVKAPLIKKNALEEELQYDAEALDVCPREEKDCDSCDILSCPEEK